MAGHPRVGPADVCPSVVALDVKVDGRAVRKGNGGVGTSRIKLVRNVIEMTTVIRTTAWLDSRPCPQPEGCQCPIPAGEHCASTRGVTKTVPERRATQCARAQQQTLRWWSWSSCLQASKHIQLMLIQGRQQPYLSSPGKRARHSLGTVRPQSQPGGAGQRKLSTERCHGCKSGSTVRST